MNKQGQQRDYESVYLRRTFRDGAKVRNETVANLSALPAEAVAAIEATLKGQTLVAAGSEFTTTRTLPHGHVAAVWAMARQLVVGTGVPVTRFGVGADRLTCDRTGRQAEHTVMVGRHHLRC